MVTSVNSSLLAALAAQNKPASQAQDAAPQARVSDQARPSGDIYAGADGSPSLSAVLTAQDSLNRAASMTDVGLAAGGSIADLLSLAADKANQALQGSPDQQSGFGGDFQALLQTIDQIANSASYQGVTMLNGGQGQDLTVQASLAGGAPLNLSFPDLTTSGPVLGLAGADLSGGDISGVLDQINQASANLTSALGQLKSQSEQVQGQLGLVGQLQGALSGGARASESAEAAQLQALQVQQALAEQGAAIGNQAPQALLALFRG